MAEWAARLGMERGLAGPRVRALGALAALALAACAAEAPRPASPTAAEPRPSPAPTPAAPAASADAGPSAEPAAASSPPAQGLPPAKLGEMCGGFAGIACASGLVCANVMPVADGSGTCRKANGAP